MAPSELVGCYKVYKSKTKALIYWLTRTAGTCCDLTSVIKSLASSLPPKPSRRQNNESSEVEIQTAELVKLAQAIAASDPPADVPQGIILVLQDIIHGREECAEWYSAQALGQGSKVERENQTHRYFILVLRRILDLLKAARAKFSVRREESFIGARGSNREINKSSASTDTFGNIFENLNLEEPSSDALGDAPKAVPVSPGVTRHLKLQNEQDDSAFEVFCFLRDLAEIRTSVNKAWEEYVKGDISFLAASSITDTAFGILRRADEEFAQDGPLKSSRWVDILEYLGLRMFRRGTAVWLCPNGMTKAPVMATSPVNVAELLCPTAIYCLESNRGEAREFCDKDKLGERPADQQFTPCGTQFCHDYHNLHPMCHVLGRLVPQVHAMAHVGPCAHIVIDEFLQGLIDQHRRNRQPMWLAVACQIYMELHDEIGDHLGYGVKTLQETLDRNVLVVADVQAYMASSQDFLYGAGEAIDRLSWTASASNRFEDAYRKDERVSKYLEGNGAAESDATSQDTATAHRGVISLLERSLPAHAGAVLTDLKIGMYDAGCMVANHNSYILSIAHLYRAFRATGALDTNWQDIEFVLPAFGAKKSLVAKPDAEYDNEAGVRHYHMALGVSAAEFAPDARTKHTTLRDARKISIGSPLIQALCDRQIHWEDRDKHQTKRRIVEAVLNALAPGEAVAESRSRKRLPWLRSKMTPAELLAAFKTKLLCDESMLSFDLISFALSCARLLDTLAIQVGPLLRMFEMEHDYNHVGLVTHLLRYPAYSKAVREAASILRNHIKEQGKFFVKQAYDQSSGRIPKDLRPTIQYDALAMETSRLYISTILDYAGTKYSFTGPSLCAYHPGIIPEGVCSCCEVFDGDGGETDPKDHVRKRKVVSHGSALPKAIVDAARLKIKEDPTALHECQRKLEEFQPSRLVRGTVADMLKSALNPEVFDFQEEQSHEGSDSTSEAIPTTSHDKPEGY